MFELNEENAVSNVVPVSTKDRRISHICEIS